MAGRAGVIGPRELAALASAAAVAIAAGCIDPMDDPPSKAGAGMRGIGRVAVAPSAEGARISFALGRPARILLWVHRREGKRYSEVGYADLGVHEPGPTTLTWDGTLDSAPVEQARTFDVSDLLPYEVTGEPAAPTTEEAKPLPAGRYGLRLQARRLGKGQTKD